MTTPTGPDSEAVWPLGEHRGPPTHTGTVEHMDAATTHRSMRWVVWAAGVVGAVLIYAGVYLGGFVGYQLWGTSISAGHAQAELTAELARTAGLDGDITTAELAAELAQHEPGQMSPPAVGEPVGVLDIAAIGARHVIVEGVGTEQLRQGPGRYPDTALPGEAGNMGVAGHRTTYGAPFHRIDELAVGDEIVVTTTAGTYTYEVIPAPGTHSPWHVVDPSRVDVLDNTGSALLTLTACHPKYSARQRIIVHAELVGSPRDPQAPTSDEQVEVIATETGDELVGGDSTAAAPAALYALLGFVVMSAAGTATLRARTSVRIMAGAAGAAGAAVLMWVSYTYLNEYLPPL